MKKLLGFIILAALCTTLLIGAAAATFTNPVASGADPYILNDNGTYYLTFSVGAPTRETHFEGTFASLATNENVIYVAHYDGLDTNAGTKAAPVKTIEKAAELLKTTGGHIIIMQDYINDTTLDIPAADAPLYIGGSKDKDILFSMKFIRVNSPVYFDNLLAPATANNNSLIV